MFKQPVNNYGVRYYSNSQSYPSTYSNYYRNPTPSLNSNVRYVTTPMRSFTAPPITMPSNHSSFANQGISSLGGGLLRSPIGVPQSNGFIPKVGGLLGNLGQGAGLGSKFSGLSFSTILGGIQKTVSTVNQVVPLYQQIKPVINNGKTFLKMMRASKNINAFTDDTAENKTNNTQNNVNSENNHEVIEFVEKKPEVEIDFNQKPQNEPSKPFYA